MKPYTDKYYGKDGYRTKQYTARLELDTHFAQPIVGYEFNDFRNRKYRRQLAKTRQVFKFGVWRESIKKLNNIQTYIKPIERTA